MDQIKIGKFIASIRKGMGMTQRQLADEIGVSDKTISKWETGNGMPELSSVMPLCQILQINVNELLSGEHLSEDSYSRKAEENMMNLIHETEKSKQENKSSLIFRILSLILNIIVLVMLFLLIGLDMPTALWLDLPTFLIILFVATLALSVSRQWKYFFQAFAIFFHIRKEYTEKEAAYCSNAIKLVGNASLIAGALVTAQGFIYTIFDISLQDKLDFLLMQAGVTFPICLLGIFYGCILYLLLLPVKSRLTLLCQRLHYNDN